ncbi:hypothetical protein SDC9_111854 [bioreactor metagenome]|uniref:DUF4115 domain-containing protein n=1 Tax=bioreactor metagenome TaxID=1076179 RepID=A0A645BI66_9ZZZZ
MKLQKIEDNQEMEKSIQKQAKIHNLNSVIEKKIDVPMMSLIIVIIILLITLTSVFFIYILPQWQDPADNFEQADPIIETPVTEDPATETPITDPIVTTVSVTEIDSRTYQISGWTEGENVSLKINFGRDTWIKVFYDGVVTDNPASKTYLSGSEIEILYAAKTDGEIVISLGGMKGNTIYVNDALVQLDSTVTEYNSGIKLTFVLKGE